MLYENIVVYPIGLGNGKVSRTIYEETNTFIEKWSKVIHFAFVRVSLPFIAGPYFILSYFQYFINDLGSEAFYLPFLIWYFILVEFRINRSTYFCLGYIFLKESIRLAKPNWIFGHLRYTATSYLLHHNTMHLCSGLSSWIMLHYDRLCKRYQSRNDHPE